MPSEANVTVKLDTTIEALKEFHSAFNVPMPDSPTIDDDDRVKLRIDLLKEELEELDDAYGNDDKVAFLDALVDLQYVLDGAFVEFGFSSVKLAAFAEVHASNMSKLDANGEPILREDGKILKGPNYFPPRLEQFINE